MQSREWNKNIRIIVNWCQSETDSEYCKHMGRRAKKLKGENFRRGKLRHLAKISSLFPDENFPGEFFRQKNLF